MKIGVKKRLEYACAPPMVFELASSEKFFMKISFTAFLNMQFSGPGKFFKFSSRQT